MPGSRARAQGDEPITMSKAVKSALCIAKTERREGEAVGSGRCSRWKMWPFVVKIGSYLVENHLETAIQD